MPDTRKTSDVHGISWNQPLTDWFGMWFVLGTYTPWSRLGLYMPHSRQIFLPMIENLPRNTPGIHWSKLIQKWKAVLLWIPTSIYKKLIPSLSHCDSICIMWRADRIRNGLRNSGHWRISVSQQGHCMFSYLGHYKAEKRKIIKWPEHRLNSPVIYGWHDSALEAGLPHQCI